MTSSMWPAIGFQRWVSKMLCYAIQMWPMRPYSVYPSLPRARYRSVCMWPKMVLEKQVPNYRWNWSKLFAKWLDRLLHSNWWHRSPLCHVLVQVGQRMPVGGKRITVILIQILYPFTGKTMRKAMADFARNKQVILPGTVEDPSVFHDVRRALQELGYAMSAPEPHLAIRKWFNTGSFITRHCYFSILSIADIIHCSFHILLIAYEIWLLNNVKIIS